MAEFTNQPGEDGEITLSSKLSLDASDVSGQG